MDLMAYNVQKLSYHHYLIGVYLYRSVTICLFCVFTVTLSKIKVKEDKYTKILAKNQICEIIHLRDITQIYKALYGDTLLVSL